MIRDWAEYTAIAAIDGKAGSTSNWYCTNAYHDTPEIPATASAPTSAEPTAPTKGISAASTPPRSHMNIASAPGAQSGRLRKFRATICSSASACTSTPGSTISSGDERKSINAEALAPTSAMRPSISLAPTSPDSTFQAGMRRSGLRPV